MKRHILIIEPDRMVVKAYRGAIEDAGYTTAVAQSAQQAIAEADKRLPNLVVLELQMARHNGIEFLYEFKSYTEWQGVPIIVLTSLPPSELQQYQSLVDQLEVRAVLRKSATTVALLVQKVDEVLKAARS